MIRPRLWKQENPGFRRRQHSVGKTLPTHCTRNIVPRLVFLTDLDLDDENEDKVELRQALSLHASFAFTQNALSSEGKKPLGKSAAAAKQKAAIAATA